MKTAFGLLSFAVGFTLLSGCATTLPPDALAASQQTLKLRLMQSRRLDTSDETNILTASAALLQDLGFTIDETCPDLGVLVASKTRSALEGWQIALAFLSGDPNASWDRYQRFRASVVTRPADDRKSVIVRVTFQRTVWDTEDRITRNEALNKPNQYQEFFDKLSKAVFLEANNL